MAEQKKSAGRKERAPANQECCELYGEYCYAMGFTLAVYFFTFPQLIDHGATGILWFQGITTILAGFGFVYLKKIAYAITRLLLGRDPLRRQLMASLTPTDLLKDDDKLLEFVSQGKGA